MQPPVQKNKAILKCQKLQSRNDHLSLAPKGSQTPQTHIWWMKMDEAIVTSLMLQYNAQTPVLAD